MSVGQAKNVGKSQNSIKKTFFVLNFQLINKVFLLVPRADLVIFNDPNLFSTFLPFSKCIHISFKRVSKVTELAVGKSQNKHAYMFT